MRTLVRVLGASTDEILLVLFLMALVLAGTKLGAAGDALGRWLDRRSPGSGSPGSGSPDQRG